MNRVDPPRAGAPVALVSLEGVCRSPRAPAAKPGAPATARFLVDLDAPCNMTCARCQRPGRGLPMEIDAALSLAGRVLEAIEADPPERVQLAYYGGEPLLAADALLCHCARIRE